MLRVRPVLRVVDNPRVALSLTREQESVVETALARARRRRASPRVTKALLLALGVESNYRDVGYGDRDSVGALQQRPSQGWGPASEPLSVDVDQFLDRAERENRRGGSAGQLAQRVQRSAFPERYDQRSGEAEAILRRYGGGGAAPAPARASGAGVQGSGGEQLAALLTALAPREEAGPRASMGLALPVAAAAPVLPRGAQQLASSAPRESPGAELARALTAVKALEGAGGAEAAPAAGDAAERGSGGQAAPLRPGGGYMGTKGVARQLAGLGLELGLKSTSEKRHNTNPYSGKDSDHDVGNEDAYAYDISNGSAPTAEMDRAALRIMRRLGDKKYELGQSIDTQRGVFTIRTDEGTFRVQVIYRGSGAAFGGDHRDHIHVGVKRVGR